MKDIVRNNYLIISDRGESILVGDAEWFQWLEANPKFRYEERGCTFSARKEKRRNGHYWYAYKRSRKKLIKLYIGKSQDITQEHLQYIGIKLANHQLGDKGPVIDILGVQKQRIFFLNTKITHPIPPSSMISRESIISKMNTQVVIVNAPAGYGKTTLVSEWLQSNNKLTAWVTLDSDDNSLIHFWTLLEASLIHAGLYTNLPIGEIHSNLEIFVSDIIKEIEFAIQKTQNISKIALVLDDYHEIKNADVQRSFYLFLAKLPACVQVIIVGRPSSIIEFEALNPTTRKFIIRGKDLQVSTRASIRFLEKQIGGHTYSQGKLHQLAKDLGGWVTGLNLAALILRKNQLIQIPPSLSEHDVVQSYLLENVLARQPQEIQEFLTKTSFLGELNADLCIRVTGNLNSAQILEYLWENQLFISKLDNDQDIYQYQSFFSKALQAQLSAQHPADASRLLHAAASWNLQNGYFSEAIALYLRDHQWDQAVAIIEEVSLDILKNQGEDSLLLRWFMLLPSESLKNNIDLFLLYALLVKLSLPPEYVSANLNNILEDLDSWDVDEQAQILISEFIGDLEKSKEIDESLAEWGLYIRHAEYKETIQLLSSFYNYAFINLDPNRIPSILEQAHLQNNKFIYILISANYAINLFQHNQLTQAKKHLEKVLDLLFTAGGPYPAPAAILYSILAEIFFERNQLNKAMSAIRKNREIDQNPASTNNLVSRNLLAAKIYIALNDSENGQIAIDRATRHFLHRKPSLFSKASIRAQQAALFLQKGKIDLAEQWISETDSRDFNLDLAVIKARFLLLKGEHSSLLTLLESSLAEEPNFFPIQSRIELEVLLPFTLYKLDKVFEAKKRMVQLLRRFVKERIVYPFIIIGNEILPLLKSIFHTVKISKRIKAYIINIARELGPVTDIYQWNEIEEHQATMWNITNREMEILEEVAQGYTNQEIARRLTISENTVKTHVNNIYRKFSVSCRIKAVQLAREMKII